MKNLESLNQYLSNLAVINFKLHNLHWNVTGINFAQIHSFTESLYNEAFENFDGVAEQIKMKGEMPLSTLSEYLKHASIVELKPKAFSASEVLGILISDLEHLSAQALEIRSLSNELDDFSTANLLEDHIASYEKHLWFLKSMAL